jgi:PAS domain S-box-containing protein
MSPGTGPAAGDKKYGHGGRIVNSTPRDGRILIVDDIAANLQVVADFLSGCGYDVLIAQEGEEALERAALAQPDLIMLDVLLPDANGFDVCRRLKQDPRTRHIPVIFMTALVDTEHKLAGFAAGGIDYVTKPLDLAEMQARIDTHMRLRWLQKQLEQKNAELERSRAELERRVAERTEELSKANHWLRESERKFRTLAENSPDLLIRYDRACRRVYVNPAYTTFFAMSEEEALARELGEGWYGGLGLQVYEDRLRSVMATGVRAETSMTWNKPGSTPVHFIFHIVPEYDMDGTVVHVLTIGRDITPLKEAERCLQESRSQLRELAARQHTAREEERKHIARELHDELGQFLTALRMSVSLLRVRFGQDNPALTAHAKGMTELVDRNIQVVRNVAASLRPVALDMGIQPALEWLVDDFAAHAGISATLLVEDDTIVLDEDSETTVFRIVQESLTNVARHADASCVTVTLDSSGEYCLVTVQDDGVGFNPTRIRKTSLGLLGMRERVWVVGGDIEIDSAPGKGTTVVVRVPLGRRAGQSPRAVPY